MRIALFVNIVESLGLINILRQSETVRKIRRIFSLEIEMFPYFSLTVTALIWQLQERVVEESMCEVYIFHQDMNFHNAQNPRTVSEVTESLYWRKSHSSSKSACHFHPTILTGSAVSITTNFE